MIAREDYPIRVLIYEDNTSLREALSQLLRSEKDFLLVGAFQHCKEIESQIRYYHPDIVIMDIGLPFLSGIDGLRIIKSIHPTMEVLIFTGHEEDDAVFECLQAGASGYLLKTASIEKILDSLRDIYAGGAVITPSIAKKILLSLPKQIDVKSKSDTTLSFKEHQILELLAKGKSYKMIASDLSISINSVRTMVSRCYKKLEVHSVTAAIAKLYHEK